MAGIKMVGLNNWLKRLQVTKRRVETHRPAMAVISQKGRKDVLNHFREESGPSGRWRPLKKPRQSGGSKILHDTGRLRGAISAENTDDTATVSAGTSYAATHNFGDNSRNIPQRKFLWISAQALKSMALTLSKYIIKGRA